VENKKLVKMHTGIFHEFQFGRPKNTCISAIILKTLSINIIHVAEIPVVIHDIDEATAFDLVINEVALLALRSLGFHGSLTTMIVKLWSGRRCHVKTGNGVSTESYTSALTELLFGIGQGSTATNGIFGVLHGLVMHAAALFFVGILFLSMSGTLRHAIIGEGFIDGTCLGTTNPYSTAITSSAKRELTNEEQTLHKKSNDTIQFFLNLLFTL
jgi:hypothetical protein